MFSVIKFSTGLAFSKRNFSSSSASTILLSSFVLEMIRGGAGRELLGRGTLSCLVGGRAGASVGGRAGASVEGRAGASASNKKY